MKYLSVTIHIKATEQYFLVVLFIVVCKVVMKVYLQRVLTLGVKGLNNKSK